MRQTVECRIEQETRQAIAMRLHEAATAKDVPDVIAMERARRTRNADYYFGRRKDGGGQGVCDTK